MARVCEICGKRPMTGWNPQSVGMNRKRALRRWLPNLQSIVIQRDGRPRPRPRLLALPADRREGLSVPAP